MLFFSKLVTPVQAAWVGALGDCGGERVPKLVGEYGAGVWWENTKDCKEKRLCVH